MKKLIISIITISFVFGQNPVFQQFSTLFADIVEDVTVQVSPKGLDIMQKVLIKNDKPKS